jgi:hypothetical protein
MSFYKYIHNAFAGKIEGNKVEKLNLRTFHIINVNFTQSHVEFPTFQVELNILNSYSHCIKTSQQASFLLGVSLTMLSRGSSTRIAPSAQLGVSIMAHVQLQLN